MITGDHPMTAVYIGIESEMIPKGVELLFVDTINGNVIFKDLLSNEVQSFSRVESKLRYGNTELILTGSAFKELNKLNWLQQRLDGLFY
jgi:magnesium-transporting ATPase (P-type)